MCMCSGGRLSYLIPTTWDFTTDDLPMHPCLTLRQAIESCQIYVLQYDSECEVYVCRCAIKDSQLDTADIWWSWRRLGELHVNINA